MVFDFKKSGLSLWFCSFLCLFFINKVYALAGAGHAFRSLPLKFYSSLPDSSLSLIAQNDYSADTVNNRNKFHYSLDLGQSMPAKVADKKQRVHFSLDMRFGAEDYILNTLSFMYAWRKGYIEFGPNLRFLGGKYCKFKKAKALCRDKGDLDEEVMDYGLKGFDGGIFADFFFQKNPVRFLGALQRHAINLRLNYFYRKGSPWDTHYVLLSPRFVFNFYPSKEMKNAIVISWGFEAYTPLLKPYKYFKYNGVFEIGYSYYF